MTSLEELNYTHEMELRKVCLRTQRHCRTSHTQRSDHRKPDASTLLSVGWKRTVHGVRECPVSETSCKPDG